MFSRFAADLVLLAHLAFILFVVLGGWLVLRRHWVAWFHIPAALWGATVELMGWVCPLTPLENQLRASSGSAGYDGSFIARYLIPVVYPTSLTLRIWCQGRHMWHLQIMGSAGRRLGQSELSGGA